MLVKTAAPDKRILGSTYGVSQTVACVARAVAPAFVGWATILIHKSGLTSKLAVHCSHFPLTNNSFTAT
jgi:hypothetical protein